MVFETTVRARKQKQYNHHSTGRLMLAMEMKHFCKIMVIVFTKDLRMDSPSTSGEFIS